MIEITPFLAELRAAEEAARGKFAEPMACGTCRGRVADGKTVEHDECAERALLLEAADHPSYELITSLTEDELAALPPRFHIPVFDGDGQPNLWLCAVCWGDGWVTHWPCKTALKHGTKVFTPQYHAQRRHELTVKALEDARAQVTALTGLLKQARNERHAATTEAS